MKIGSLLIAGLLLAACSSATVEFKKGEKFEFDGQELVVDYKVSSVLID